MIDTPPAQKEETMAVVNAPEPNHRPRTSERFRQIPANRRAKDRIFSVLCFAAAAIGVIMLAILLYQILGDGLGRLSLDFLTSWPGRVASSAGIKAALWGSAWIMVLTAVISVPVGVAAAIYLEEFNRRRNRFTEFVQLNISNLAGVPSIVYGILGLTIFVRGMGLERSVIAGALTMSLLILPMLITVTQEALRAVPQSFREGSLALGATTWQTIRRQTLPAASSGIWTGIILAMSRAIGETAPLLIVGAAAFIRFVPGNITDDYTVLPIQIYNWASQPNVKFHEAAAAGIIVLLGALLLLNSLAIYLRFKSSRKLRA